MERNGEAGREIRRSGSAEEDENPNRATASAMQLREARSVHNGFCTEEWGRMQRERVHRGKQACAAGWFSFKQTADELMLPHKLPFLYPRVLAALAFDTICLSVWSVRAGEEHSSGTRPAVATMTSLSHLYRRGENRHNRVKVYNG